MKLELNTENLQIEFTCSGDKNHMNTLNLLHHLIEHLNSHKDVRLSITSLTHYPDADQNIISDYEDADPH